MLGREGCCIERDLVASGRKVKVGSSKCLEALSGGGRRDRVLGHVASLDITQPRVMAVVLNLGVHQPLGETLFSLCRYQNAWDSPQRVMWATC